MTDCGLSNTTSTLIMLAFVAAVATLAAVATTSEPPLQAASVSSSASAAPQFPWLDPTIGVEDRVCAALKPLDWEYLRFYTFLYVLIVYDLLESEYDALLFHCVRTHTYT